MNDSGIKQLIKHPAVLQASDSVRRAAGVIRASDGSRVLVIRDGKIAGLIGEQSIAGFLASAPDADRALDQPIEPLVQYYPTFVNESVSAREAAKVFADNQVDMLPVVDQYGGLMGVVYLSDVVGSLTSSLRPPTVGGMATPLGVYLTTGSVSGGAGSFGLYLTGIAMGLMTIFGTLAGDGVTALLRNLAGPVSPFSTAVTTLSAAFSVIVLLVLLRLTPLAGYHAAEHMTVHAIEAGEDLTPSIVKRMPRVHGRCGTNILAGAMIFMIITSRFHSSDIAILAAMVVLVIGWRSVGNTIQATFTTKLPDEKQLQSGIRAGQEILRKFSERPGYVAYGFRRIWNMGFLQAAAGMGTVLSILYAVETHFKLDHFF